LVRCIEEKIRLEMLQRTVLTMHADVGGDWEQLKTNTWANNSPR
jgi:hypothetical protein